MVRNSRRIVAVGASDGGDFTCECGYTIKGGLNSVRLRVKLHQKKCEKAKDIGEVMYSKEDIKQSTMNKLKL